MVTNALVPASGVDLLTAAQPTATVLIAVCNYSALSGTFDLYVVPNGSVPSLSTVAISGRELESLESVFLDTTKFLLDVGDVINVKASGDDQMTATISYLPI